MTIRIGIFDSGVGGFSVLNEVIKRHGDIPCVYLGDIARVPYGVKSPYEMRLIAQEIINWLQTQEVNAVLIACNTTNSLALDIVEKFAGGPVFGLIESAVDMINEKRIGVLATPATVASKAYTSNIFSSKPGTFVLEQSCPEFVPMIESGQFNNNFIRKLAIKYLNPLLKANVQSIILGCSHYSLLQPLLRELIPSNIRLIDPAIGLAMKLDELMANQQFPPQNSYNFTKTRFCVTSNITGFASKAMFWLGSYPKVELISLQSKACVS